MSANKSNAYLDGSDILGASAQAVEVEYLDDVVALAERAVDEIAAAVSAQEMTSFENTDGGRTVDGGGPTGAFRAERAKLLKSEVPGVDDEAWTDFVLAMKTALPSAVSASNGLGLFEMKIRRLADLGLVKNLKNKRSSGGRMIWTGDWVSPMTEKKFLASAQKQYEAFVASVKAYVAGLADGTIANPDGGRPEGMSLSGILAVLHKCGPSGLKTWNDEENRFSDTIALFDATNGIF